MGHGCRLDARMGFEAEPELPCYLPTVRLSTCTHALTHCHAQCRPFPRVRFLTTNARAQTLRHLHQPGGGLAGGAVGSSVLRAVGRDCVSGARGMCRWGPRVGSPRVGWALAGWASGVAAVGNTCTGRAVLRMCVSLVRRRACAQRFGMLCVGVQDQSRSPEGVPATSPSSLTLLSPFCPFRPTSPHLTPLRPT